MQINLSNVQKRFCRNYKDDDVKSLEKKETRYTVNYLHGQVNFLVTNAMQWKRELLRKKNFRFTL